jgi:FkbM family methyltransferase
MTSIPSYSARRSDAVFVGSPGRQKSGWRKSYNLGQECVIPLELGETGIETRVFLKHDGIFYLQPLGDWQPRDQIKFLPEAPGSYTVVIEWRTRAGQSGWTEAEFDLNANADLDPSPRLVEVDRDVRLWVPSAWESHMAPAHERAAIALAASSLRKDAVIYDIGANLGLYSVLLSRIAGSGGRVYCFEANPVCLYFLQANLTLNRVRNFEILPVAIFASPAPIEFRINYRNLLVGIAGSITYMGKPGHVIDVSAAALDDLIETHELAPPDFIKMDIEGAEQEAVKGMRRTIVKQRPTFLMELHGRPAAQGTLAGADWSGYQFHDAASGRVFDTADALASWFPDACLQILARPS